MRLNPIHVLAAVLILAPTGAFAYVGPGLGAGAIAAVLGVIGSLFLGLFAVVYYPIKRVLRRRRQGPQADHTKRSPMDGSQ